MVHAWSGSLWTNPVLRIALCFLARKSPIPFTPAPAIVAHSTLSASHPSIDDGKHGLFCICPLRALVPLSPNSPRTRILIATAPSGPRPQPHDMSRSSPSVTHPHIHSMRTSCPSIHPLCRERPIRLPRRAPSCDDRLPTPSIPALPSPCLSCRHFRRQSASPLDHKGRTHTPSDK